MVQSSILVTFCAVFVLVCGNTINNVRLVGYDTYIISLIEKTLWQVEELEWSTLKVNDVILDLNENVLGSELLGRVEYTNGFVVSIQWVDVITSSVQQVWTFDRAANTTRVEVQASLRLHSVTIGFDVVANLANGTERYTATFVHPLLTFEFRVIKDMFLDDINVTVALGANMPRNNNAPRFLPNTKHSQAFAALYDWNSMMVGIRGWGPEIFQPIAYKLATTEIPFPRICYYCPVN